MANSIMRCVVGAAVLAATLTACGRGDNDAPQSPVAAENTFVIENVKIFDGETISGATSVTVEKGVITSLGGAASGDVRVIDGAGKTLMPGMIDAHVHAFDDAALKNALLFGVAAQLDMFTATEFAAANRGARDSTGRTDKADFFSAGTLVTSPGGHGTQFGLPIPTIEDPADAEEFVRARLAEGSDYIKIVYEPDAGILPSISKETMAAVVAAAHEQGALAVVHISSLAAARDVVEAGADGLVHIFADEPIDDALLAAMAEAGVFVIPTLAIVASIAGEGTGAELAADPDLSPYLTGTQRGFLEATYSGGPSATEYVNRFNVDIALENVRRMHEAGVVVLAGTDAPNPGTAYGVSMHGELQFLSDAGLSPEAALAAATSAPAKAFGLEERGMIAPGMRADMILVDGDPSEDVRAARKIVTVFKNGFEISRAGAAGDAEQPAADASPLTDGLVSDFEEGLGSNFVAPWTATTDQLANGASTATLSRVDAGADGSAGALRVDGEISTQFPFPWSGAGVFFSTDFSKSFDLSEYEKITFDARGGERDLVIMFFTRTSMQRPATATVKINADWQTYTVDLAGIEGAAMDETFGLAFTAGRPEGAFYFELDNVRFE